MFSFSKLKKKKKAQLWNTNIKRWSPKVKSQTQFINLTKPAQLLNEQTLILPVIKKFKFKVDLIL